MERNKQTEKKKKPSKSTSINSSQQEARKGARKSWNPSATWHRVAWNHKFSFSQHLIIPTRKKEKKEEKLSTKEQGYLLFLICKCGSHSFLAWSWMVPADKCLIKLTKVGILCECVYVCVFFHLDDPTRSSPDPSEELVPRTNSPYLIFFKPIQVNMWSL